MRRFGAQLVWFGPNAGAHRVAIRCAVSVGVPMIVLVAVGRVDLLGAAAFGAFAAVYGRDLAGASRARLQTVAGAALIASVAIGLVAAHLPLRPWTSALVVVAVAVAATVLSRALRFTPAGPLFFVFASGAFAGGAPIGGAASALVAAVTAGSAAFAVGVGGIDAFLARGRWERPAPAPAPVPRAWRDAMRDGSVVDVLAASAVAGVLAIALGLQHGYWAMLSAVVPASVSLRGPWLAKGTLRVVGTAAGLVVAAPLLMLDLHGWGIVVVALTLQLATELFVPRNYGFAMLFITPLALLISSTAQPGPVGVLLSDRFWGTVLGIGVGLLVLTVRAVITGARAPRTATG